MSILGKIKSHLGDVAATDRELQSKIAAAEARIQELQRLPISREDYILHGERSIDAMGRHHLENLRDQVKNFDLKRDPLDFQAPDRNFRLFAPNLMSGHLSVTPSALAFHFGDLLKQSFARSVAALDWPATNPGPPLADRQAELARLDKDLAGLRKEREELHRELAASGIKLM